LLKPNEPVSLWLISVDSAEDHRGFSEKIAADGKGKIPFPMLTDTGHQVIDRYGLQDPRYLKQKRAGIPYPTVYVIDKTGKVMWSRTEENFRERPSNDDIRRALSELKP